MKNIPLFVLSFLPLLAYSQVNLGTEAAQPTRIKTNDVTRLEFSATGDAIFTSSIGMPVRTITATGTSTLAAVDYLIRLDATAGIQTITLGTPTYNRVLRFKRIDNNPATVITFTGTIDAVVNPTSTGGSSPISELAAQFGVVEIMWNGTSWDKISQ